MSRITPPTPNTALTPAYSSVSSAAGFQSGDLVYFRDSNFGTIPGNAVTSANFNLNATVNLNQNAFNPTVGWASYNPTGRNGSTTTRAPSAAQLTSGNIVVVYAENAGGGAGPAGFEIIDQNGATVVANTSFGRSTSSGNSGSIGVAALTGGGFAVALLDQASSQISVAVYNNSGTVVTAFSNDSHFGNPYIFDIKPLPNGGFVIASNSSPTSAGSYRTRVYSSTGAPGASANVTGWGSTITVPIIGVFSDSSFGLLMPTTNTSLSIFRFSSAGAFVGSVTVTSSNYFNSANYEFIVATDNVGRIFHVENASPFRMALYTITSAGSVSGATFLGSTNYTQSINAAPLSGGGYVFTRPAFDTGTVILVRHNSSDTQVSQVSLVGFGAYIPNNYNAQSQRTTIVEGATWLTFIDNTPVSDSLTYGSMPYVQINKSNVTTSGIRVRNPNTLLVGISSAAVSGYARSASTPNAASFLAANTQTISRAINATTGTDFALTPYLAIVDAVTWQSMTEMNNGQFVIVYRTTGGAVRFSVFNPDGAIVSTINVAGAGAASNLVRCTCLGNGKLVISWVPVANNDIFYNVYSTTYTLLATGTASIALGTITSPGDFNGGRGHDIGVFGNDSFVVGMQWNSNSILSLVVYNDSAVYQSRRDLSISSANNIQVASDASGMAVLRIINSSNSGDMYYFSRGNSAYSLVYYWQMSNGNYNTANFNEGFAMMPNGLPVGFMNQSGNRRLWRQVPNGTNYEITGFGSISNSSAAICPGQSGEIVGLIFQNSGTTHNWTIWPANMDLGPYGTTVGQGFFSNGSFTISDYRTGSTGPRPQIVNLYDNLYAFSYIDTASNIRVGLLCTVATTYSTTITAGVTASNTALIPSPANGYYLAGVSASECAAGGTGVLQVNGAATLSSQYPAGTPSQAFDFNVPGLDVGVRGTISGRNMIISGGK